MSTRTLHANLVDIPGKRTRPVTLAVAHGRIASITDTDESPTTFILPGFIDAHVHVESSMLTPANFAAAAAVHGTVATVSDPQTIPS